MRLIRLLLLRLGAALPSHQPLHNCHNCCTTPQVFGGLLPEAAMLLEAGMAPNTTMATRAIGYRQACEWLLQVRGRGGPWAFRNCELLHAQACGGCCRCALCYMCSI